ncbi:hypothetical protein [Aestuariivivens sediminis]|uniref:hypothetical protein n=1 Tax=Aestuariivivens sediminis TaxID=2913557 RepID=UPI001F57C578|nr:hypothetical protein [Aestuariivivens sediminis]
MKLKNKGLTDLWHERMAQKDKDLGSLEMAMNKEIDHYRSEIKVLQTKLTDFDALKNEKSKLEVELKNTEKEKNALKDENTSLKKDEQNRIRDHQKAIEATITLQSSLEKEKERLNDERVQQEKERLEALRETWANHEKDVENHIRLICKNNVITYIEQNDFPYAGRKPDNTIEILDQLIIFDAKSPANDDLKNFPKYIKSQTENLKKYTKHENVKNDIFLVIPSNTLQVIKDVIYNIGDYNVYIISKDALEPIILSLKKIEDYEFADKLSPEDRDNICRIIGKFAHTTKRKIQIEQFFASEFLDILQKSKTLLPTEILKSVIEFENAEKLNPPMEKRKKPILTKDLIDQTNQLKKEIELRNIPQIEAKITFKEDN